METAISCRIYERFLRELEDAGPKGRRLAEELGRLYREDRIRHEQSLVDLYERLAESEA